MQNECLKKSGTTRIKHKIAGKVNNNSRIQEGSVKGEIRVSVILPVYNPGEGEH